MRRLLLSAPVIFILLFTGCTQGASQSELALQTQVALQATQIAELQEQAAAPTSPGVHEAATPTRIRPTATPTGIPPTPTPVTPTSTPKPAMETIERNETQQIGPIWDSLYDETFSMEVTLLSVQWYSGGGWADEPKSGNVFAIAHVVVKNLGPGASRSVSPMDFQAMDANGAVRSDTYVYEARDCRLEFVDLTVGGSIEGCVSFEVPEQGRVDFIYAPFQYEGLEPGRYLSFSLRP